MGELAQVMTIPMNLQKLRESIKKWQVEVMGNACTICYGDNVYSECSACGWWGKVQPETNRDD